VKLAKGDNDEGEKERERKGKGQKERKRKKEEVDLSGNYVTCQTNAIVQLLYWTMALVFSP